MATLDELIQDLSNEEVYDELIARLREKGVPVTAWQPGEPMDAFAQTVAEFFRDKWNGTVAPALRAAFLDKAEGAWLTILAWSVYGVIRFEKTFATSKSIRVKNLGGVPWTINAGDIVIKNATNNKTFYNTTGGFLPASGSPIPYLDLIFLAIEAGSDSNTLVDDIAENPVSGPVSVVVDKAAASNLPLVGSDGESDEELRERCRLSSAVSPIYYESGEKKEFSFGGPAAAYKFVSLSSLRADGTPVSVNRVSVVDKGNCELEVWLAGPSGPTPGDMLTAGTDVFTVYTNILSKINTTGLTVSVYGAIEAPADYSYNVAIDRDSGITKEEAEAAIEKELIAYFSTFPIGGQHKTPPINGVAAGYLYLETLDGVVQNAVTKIRGNPKDVVSVDRVLPTPSPAVVTLFYNQVATIATLNVVATVVSQ